eukprot:gene17555-20947_t
MQPIKTKIRHLLFSLIFFLASSFAYAQQKPVTIVFRYKKEAQPLESYWFELGKPLNRSEFKPSGQFPGKIISTVCKNDTCETTCQYSVPETTCASIGDLFRHEIIVIPGDSVRITMGLKDKTKMSGKFGRLWGHELAYAGKNQAVYALFDSLANHEGDLRMETLMGFGRKFLPLDSFCNAAKARYLRRIDFLKSYAQHYFIPADVQRLVSTEIYSFYLNNLIQPLLSSKFEIGAYPKEFSDLIRNSKFDNTDLYFKTLLYNWAAYQFSSLGSDFKTQDVSQQELISTYNWIKKNHNGKVRDHQLTLHLEQHSYQYHQHEKTIDSLFKDFKSKSADKDYVHFLDSALTTARNKKEMKYSMEQVMASELKDLNQKKSSVQSLFRKKPVLLICWASWCKPCLAQIPAEHDLEKKYGDQIDFVYLSFDQDEKAWLAKSDELKLTGNNYLLAKNFRSDMAQFYKITSIPRYFIYDKNGNPYPSGSTKKIKTMKKIAVIYDLYQTILPTRSIPADTFQPVFEAIKAANKGDVQETVLEEAFEELWRKSMEVVAQEYNFSQAMFDAGKNALIHTDYQLVLKPFDDFEVIKEIPAKRFLVTTGLSKLQQAKINALFQPGDFEAVFIDDPYQENRLGKMTIFSQIAVQHQLTADQVWIVGDNPDAEIAAGNALGMKTVQILRPGIAKGDTAFIEIFRIDINGINNAFKMLTTIFFQRFFSVVPPPICKKYHPTYSRNDNPKNNTGNF